MSTPFNSLPTTYVVYEELKDQSQIQNQIQNQKFQQQQLQQKPQPDSPQPQQQQQQQKQHQHHISPQLNIHQPQPNHYNRHHQYQYQYQSPQSNHPAAGYNINYAAFRHSPLIYHNQSPISPCNYSNGSPSTVSTVSTSGSTTCSAISTGSSNTSASFNNSSLNVSSTSGSVSENPIYFTSPVPTINRNYSMPLLNVSMHDNVSFNRNGSVPIINSNINNLDCLRTSQSLISIDSKIYKRQRKKFDEIDRHYLCNFENCNKAYGTLNHLNTHVMIQNHGPKRMPEEFTELRKMLKEKKNNVSKPGIKKLTNSNANSKLKTKTNSKPKPKSKSLSSSTSKFTSRSNSQSNVTINRQNSTSPTSLSGSKIQNLEYTYNPSTIPLVYDIIPVNEIVNNTSNTHNAYFNDFTNSNSNLSSMNSNTSLSSMQNPVPGFQDLMNINMNVNNQMNVKTKFN